jgi:putative phosphoribosyl transferase
VNHRVIPTRPSLEQYRKQAKDLLDGVTKQTPDALDRVSTHHPRLKGQALPILAASEIRLCDAQLVIAREHGFESWPKFSAHLRAMQGVQPDAFVERLRIGDAELTLEISGRHGARALVMFALAGNVSRYHSGIREVAAVFNRASFCTVLADLLTEDEDVEDSINETMRYDIPLLAGRAMAVIDRFANDSAFQSLRMGVFGSGTGAAGGVAAASKRSAAVRAVVCSAGRPDLAGSALAWLNAPTLFVSGGDDTVGYGFMRTIFGVLPPHVPKQLEVIDGAAARFDAAEHVERAAALALAWFSEYLGRDSADEERRL